MTSRCRRYHVTSGGFYARLRREESAHAKQDRVLTKVITRVVHHHKESTVVRVSTNSYSRPAGR